MAADTGNTKSRLFNKLAYDLANIATTVTTTSSDLIPVYDVTAELVGKVTLGDLTVADLTAVATTIVVGEDGTGYDVKFFSATSGKSWLWDESADKMIVTGASDLLGNTQQTGTLTVGVDDTGYDVTFFGATAGKKFLWDESADKLIVTGGGSFSDGVATKQAVTNVHDTTPTAAELTTAFGDPATIGRGFLGTVDDNDGDAISYIVWATDASYYFVIGTKAA